MPKVAIELTPLAVSKIKVTGWHAVGHVSGLGLKVAPSVSRAWVLRKWSLESTVSSVLVVFLQFRLHRAENEPDRRQTRFMQLPPISCKA